LLNHATNHTQFRCKQPQKRLNKNLTLYNKNYGKTVNKSKNNKVALSKFKRAMKTIDFFLCWKQLLQTLRSNMENICHPMFKNHSPPNFMFGKDSTIFLLNNKTLMKTTKLFFILTLFSFLTSNAQITKGNWMVGGTGNFSSYESTYKSNGNEITNKGIGINISPKIGYFLADKFVIGTSLSIGYTKPKESDNSFGYGIGPYARYYFLNVDRHVNFFTEVNYIFGETKSGDNKSKSNGYGLKAGSVFFFNNSVGLEVSLDYNSSKLAPNNSDNSTYNNLQIGLGFQIHLEK
jgi:hypothetical protein